MASPGGAAIRSGAVHEQFPATFPSGQGSDLAGVVTEIRPDVEAFAVGEEVLGWSWTRSSHATRAVVPVGELVPEPSQLTWEVAGSLHVVGCTAHAAVAAVDPRPARPSRCPRGEIVLLP